MGASYPIIHYGFRCRRPDLDAHQMPPCRLAQSLEEICKLESMCESTAPNGGLMSPIPCEIPKASIQLAGFAIKLGPQSNGIGRMFRYGSLADMQTSPRHIRFTPDSGHWAAHFKHNNQAKTMGEAASLPMGTS